MANSLMTVLNFITMYFNSLLVLAFIVLTIYMIKGSFVIIHQGNVMIVSRIGGESRIIRPGVHFIIPILDSIIQANITGRREANIPTSELIYDPEPISCTSKDRYHIKIDTVVTYSIVDPLKAVYAIQDLRFAISRVIHSGVRNSCASSKFDDLISNGRSSSILDMVKAQFKDLENEWGVKIGKIEIEDISASPEIMKSTERITIQQKEIDFKLLSEMNIRESKLKEAETAQKIKLLEIEAEAKRKLIIVENEANIIKLTADANAYKRNKEIESEGFLLKQLKNDGADLDYLKIKLYSEAWKSLSNSTTTQMVVPCEFANFLGPVKSLVETFHVVNK